MSPLSRLANRRRETGPGSPSPRASGGARILLGPLSPAPQGAGQPWGRASEPPRPPHCEVETGGAGANGALLRTPRALGFAGRGWVLHPQCPLGAEGPGHHLPGHCAHLWAWEVVEWRAPRCLWAAPCCSLASAGAPEWPGEDQRRPRGPTAELAEPETSGRAPDLAQGLCCAGKS